MRVLGYIRVSTEEQATLGVSLDAQAEKIKAYCSLYDLELVEIITDRGQSASTLKRPGMQRVIDTLNDDCILYGDIDGVVVSKLDRLTRSLRDLSYLIETYFNSRFVLFSVSENLNPKTAAGRLVLNVLAAVAQWEREAIAERTSVALQHLRSLGRYTGGHVQYGFRREGDRLVPDSREQEMISIAQTLKDNGLSLRKVGATLLDMGFAPRNGGVWNAQQVKNLLAEKG